jgi:hypothetical protein
MRINRLKHLDKVYLNCYLVYLQLADLVGRRLDRGPDKRGIGRTPTWMDCTDAEGFWRLPRLLD